MKIEIQIEAPFQKIVRADWLRTAARAALEAQVRRAVCEVTILVSGDEQIQALNRDFMDSDRPTDVLSFPAEAEGAETDGYLGDIIISVPQAAAQAAKGGHPLRMEIELLTVHGILHLLGHDHADPAERERMWAAQKNILEMLQNPLAAMP